MLQLVITAKSGRFELSENVNDPLVKVLTDGDSRIFLGSSTGLGSPVIGFEGPETNLNSLLRRGDLTYCLEDPSVTLDYYVNQRTIIDTVAKKRNIHKKQNGGEEDSSIKFFKTKPNHKFIIDKNNEN